MEPRLFRLAYAVEFLVALIAFFECWSQVAGQAPLDLMPWWLKLVIAVSFGLLAVRLTSVAMQQEAFPQLKLIRWSLAMLVFLVAISLTTYYFYLHEPVDEDSGDEPLTSSAAAIINACG